MEKILLDTIVSPNIILTIDIETMGLKNLANSRLNLLHNLLLSKKNTKKHRRFNDFLIPSKHDNSPVCLFACHYH